MTNPEELAIAICNRYTGVGADGWILLAPSIADDSDGAIRVFNSDGSEAEISGNGTRCVAALLAREQPDRTEFRIQTAAGIKHLRLISRTETELQFEMNMGQVRVTDLNASIQGRNAVLVNAGNPQCAVPVEDFEFDWRSLGKAIESDGRFPNRTNVSFFRALDRHRIEVRFWERGAGETNSSGTGSSGAALAAIARGMAESPVQVLTPAGPLIIRSANSVYITGPAEFVAEGWFQHGRMTGND